MHQKQSVPLIVSRSCPQSSGTDSDIQSCDWQDNAAIFMNMQTSLSSSYSTSIRSMCLCVCVFHRGPHCSVTLGMLFSQRRVVLRFFGMKNHTSYYKLGHPPPNTATLVGFNFCCIGCRSSDVRDGKTLSAPGRQHLTIHPPTHTHTHSPKHLNVLERAER